MFDTYSGDYVTLPGGAQQEGSNCPVDAALAAGDALSWTSNGVSQGGEGIYRWSEVHNGCAAKGTCGRPFSSTEVGGGWQLCFAE